MFRSFSFSCLFLILASAGSAQVFNPRLAGTYRLLGANRVAITVSEAAQGATDLNGDGDILDSVLHIHDLMDGTTDNLGIAVTFCCVSPVDADRAMIVVSEMGQFSLDRNGDGDPFDEVAAILDLTTGVITNLQLAVSRVLVSDPYVVLLVSESHQGDLDLNNDADAVDDVCHLLDPISETVANLEVATGLFFRATGTRLYFDVDEAEQGGVDRNGDGDSLDQVLAVYDPGLVTITNLGLPMAAMVATTTHLAFDVPEAEHGADLNSDGDMDDNVLHLIEEGAGTPLNLTVPVPEFSFSLTDRYLGYKVVESDAGMDLNGDNDTLDNVLQIRSLANGTVWNSGVAGNTVSPHILGDNVLSSISESDQDGTDLNGDGDATDLILHRFDVLGQTRISIGLASATTGGAWSSDRLYAFSVVEADQGGTDLNGDGDILDQVIHVVQAEPLEIWNTAAIGSIFPFTIEENVLIFTSNESNNGQDLNGDGDTSDSVAQFFDTGTGLLTNTGIAGFGGAFIDGIFFLRASESQGNVDANGDGDMSDDAGYLVRPEGVGSVNLGTGPVASVLAVDGETGRVAVPLNTSFQISLDRPPAGPLSPRYLLWVWPGSSSNQVILSGGGATLGRLVNPTPFQTTQSPQPFRCVRGQGIPAVVCRDLAEVPGPAMAPWSLGNSGISRKVTFTLQALIEDGGAANASGFSVTNAVVADFK